jgi:prepilin-type N-terminal cleavage/methylation domain-containing protein
MNIKGLTLIELLVVISLIVITAGAVVINGSSSKSDVDLFNAKNSIIANISRAKEMALSGVGATNGTNYGIGVWFLDPAGKYYYIYKNKEAVNTYRGYDSGDEILEKITLPDGIKYTLTGENNLGVLFTPPTPHVAICTTATTCTGTEFWLNVSKDPSGGSIHTIKVNKSGLIE